MALAEEAKAKGNAAFLAGNYHESLRHFSQAIDLAPENHVLYSKRSAACASLGRFSDALIDARKTVALRPDWHEGYSRLGAAYAGLRRFHDAISTYKSGLDIDPNNKALQSELSRCISAIASSGDSASSFHPETSAPEPEQTAAPVPEQTAAPVPEQTAAPVPEQTAAPVPEQTAALEDDRKIRARKEEAQKVKEAGNKAYNKKDYVDALQLYTKAIELDNEEIAFLTNRAAAYLAIGKIRYCIEDCDRAVERGRELRSSPKVICRALARKGTALVRIAQSSKDYKPAIEAFQMALKEYNDPETLMKLIEAEKAKEILDRQECFDPGLADQEREKGNVFFMEGRYEEAAKCYTEAIKRNPKEPKAYSNRAACHVRLGALPEGLKDAEKCLELEPAVAKSYTRKAAIQYFMKKYEESKQTYRNGLLIDPFNQEMLEGKMRCMEETGEYGGFHDIYDY